MDSRESVQLIERARCVKGRLSIERGPVREK